MSANDTQVGGTHYRCPFQHWDLALVLGLGHFEGSIPKYVTRHRSKDGRKDLEKAIHYTKKLKESAEWHNTRPLHKYFTLGQLVEYSEANGLTPQEMMCVSSICSWSTVQDLEMLIERLEKLVETWYPPVNPAPTAQELTLNTLMSALDAATARLRGSAPGAGSFDPDR